MRVSLSAYLTAYQSEGLFTVSERLKGNYLIRTITIVESAANRYCPRFSH
jgi:hypothetical protein